MNFNLIGQCQRDNIETQSIAVQTTNKKWITITNMYCPPDGELDLSWIPIKGDTIIAGDFNGHSKIWNDFQPC